MKQALLGVLVGATFLAPAGCGDEATDPHDDLRVSSRSTPLAHDPSPARDPCPPCIAHVKGHRQLDVTFEVPEALLARRPLYFRLRVVYSNESYGMEVDVPVIAQGDETRYTFEIAVANATAVTDLSIGIYDRAFRPAELPSGSSNELPLKIVDGPGCCDADI